MVIENKILLVDDEPVTAMAEAAKLEKHGFKIKILYKGQEAIDFLKEHDDIDLILLDIEFQEGLDGIETAKKIQQNHDLPILFLTAHEDPELLKRVKSIDSYNYLLKDSSTAMIANAIHQALKLHKAQAKIKEQNKMLRKQEEESRKIVQSSRDAMAIIKDMKIHFSNRAFLDLTDFNEEQIDNVAIDHFSKFEKLGNAIMSMQLNRESERNLEFEMIGSEGSLYYIQARIIKIEIQSEPAFVLTLYDMTEQKELLKKVDKADQMADQLGNFIPICASCKKIREEKDNTPKWTEPERYISKRLPEVDFTHGICPDCAKKLYPKYRKKVDEKQAKSI